MTTYLDLTCEWCGRPLPPRGSRGPRARYCRPSCRQRAYEARLRAKAAGRHLPVEREAPPRNDGELVDLAARLENLARAQDEARDALADGELDDAAAYGQLFAAVARLNPRYAAGVLRTLAQPSFT